MTAAAAALAVGLIADARQRHRQINGFLMKQPKHAAYDRIQKEVPMMKPYRVLLASMLTVLALMLTGPPAGAQSKKPAPKAAAPKVALLDINSASKADLSALMGIG